MQTSTQDSQPNRGVRIRRDLLQTVLLVLIVVAISAGAGYAAGFQMGKREGGRLAVKKVTDYINPLNAISDNPLFPSTVLGEVVDITDTSIKIKQANGSEKTIVINDKTRVTKGSDSLSFKDVTKDSNVTVITTGKDKDQTATRIIIR